MNRNRHPSQAGALTATVVMFVAEIRNPDLDDTERLDAARLLIREQGLESREALLGLVAGTAGVLSPGALDVLADAWALEMGLP